MYKSLIKSRGKSVDQLFSLCGQMRPLFTVCWVLVDGWLGLITVFEQLVRDFTYSFYPTRLAYLYSMGTVLSTVSTPPTIATTNLINTSCYT
jgi:hypothetical protein